MTCSSALFQQKIFKRSQRAGDAAEGFHCNQSSAEQMAGSELEVRDPCPRKEEPKQNGKETENNKTRIGQVNGSNKIGKPQVDQSQPLNNLRYAQAEEDPD